MAPPENAGLGILLARAPGSPDARHALGLARAAVRRGVPVALFVMAEGADLLATPDVLSLDVPGLRLSACTQSVVDRGAPVDLPFVDYASQFQLAGIVARSARFVSFA